MITRTAKSRVDANRNMEITLLLTEQKHLLGFVLNEADWPTHEGYHPEDSSDEQSGEEGIEDKYGNLSLSKAFKHRIDVSRPEPVRRSIRKPRQRFDFIGKVTSRAPDDLERRRIREFMSSLSNYDKDHMRGPTQITIWRWCKFREIHDNKKEDFKVTSRKHKRGNNMRNASVVAYKDSQGERACAKVKYFFTARLPSELGSVYGASHPGDSDFDSEDEGTGTALHHLAFIRKITVEREDRLLKKLDKAGLAVIAVGAIESLVGRLKVEGDEYLTFRFTSMLGRMK